jgi:trigger factor
MEQVLDAYDFPIPQSLVEQQAEELLRDFAYRLVRSQLPPDALQGINWEERRAEARLRAVRDVRSALVVDRVAAAEGISVSEGAVEAELERVAEATREPLEAVRARLTKEGGLTSIENRLRFQQALDVIVKNAEVTTEELLEEPAGESQTAEAPPSTPPASQPAE